MRLAAPSLRVPERHCCEQGLDALILPGGESTAMSRIATQWGLVRLPAHQIVLTQLQVEPLRDWLRAGKPIWGTCAGLILLSKWTVSEDTYVTPGIAVSAAALWLSVVAITGCESAMSSKAEGLLGGLDVVTHRNFFGSQV